MWGGHCMAAAVGGAWRHMRQARQIGCPALLPPSLTDPCPGHVVFRVQGGTAKLADVGLARLQKGTYLSDVPLIGTFAWIAPEILVGSKQCTSAVDIYRWAGQALGARPCVQLRSRPACRTTAPVHNRQLPLPPVSLPGGMLHLPCRCCAAHAPRLHRLMTARA